MSEFMVKVVKVGEVKKHPNADTLGITKVYEYPAIVKLGELKEGDLAVFCSVDSMVPTNTERFKHLKREGRDFERVKPREIRGIFSMGLLVPADPDMKLDDDVREKLDITKYEPPCQITGGEDEPDPGYMFYYDIEGFRKYPNILKEGEEVVITEKLHGQNFRCLYRNDRLYVASHAKYKKQNENISWWKSARQYDLEDKLKTIPNIGIYCELYGNVQKMKYGAKSGEIFLAVFDVLDTMTRTWYDYDNMVKLVRELNLPLVPELYKGPWKQDLLSLADGPSMISGAKHIREGIVIKPTVNRYDPEIRRVILKHKSEKFLLGNWE